MITTNSKEIYKKALMLRTHGISKENMSEIMEIGTTK